MTRAESIKKFISNLEALSGGEQAILRHNSETILAPARPWARTRSDALTVFYKVLPAGVSLDEEELWFIVAMLRFCNRYTLADIDAASSCDFGWTLRQIRSADSFDLRVRGLLDSRYHAGDGVLADRLRQMVKLAEIKQAGINWPVFTADLLGWEDPERLTQKKWARSYYGVQVERDYEKC